jgi:CheY-like chemotaxis protein
LYVAGPRRVGGWLCEAIEKEMPANLQREECLGAVSGLARLQEEDFDLAFLGHDPPELDALQLIQAARASGADLPMLVLGNQSEQELAAVCYEQGADAYLCAHTATARTVMWVVLRAIERYQLIRENRRLLQAEDQRRQRELEEAARLLEEQRQILRRAPGFRDSYPAAEPSEPAAQLRLAGDPNEGSDVIDVLARRPVELSSIPLLPPNLGNHYRELLRTYVIMGCGSLKREVTELVEILAATGVSAASLLQLHIHVVADVIRGLGSRSSRHVINRAHLLIVELMMQLADSYRQRFWERYHPATQLFLPGFEPRLGRAA